MCLFRCLDFFGSFQFFLVINSRGEALLDCLSIYCRFDVATLYLHLFVWEGVWHLGIVACYFQKGNLEVKLRIFVCVGGGGGIVKQEQ